MTPFTPNPAVNDALALRLYEGLFSGAEFVQLEQKHLVGAQMTISGYAELPHPMIVAHDQQAIVHLVRCHMDAVGSFSHRTILNMGSSATDPRKTRFNFVLQFMQVMEKESDDDFHTVGEMRGVCGVTSDRYDRPGAVRWEEFSPTEVTICHNGIKGKDIYFFRVPKQRIAPAKGGLLPDGIIVKIGTRPADSGDDHHIANKFDPSNASIELLPPITFGSAQREDWGAF